MDQEPLPRTSVRGVGERGLTASFAVERYVDVEADIKRMLPEHWAELAVHKDIPLDPDYEAYERMDKAGNMLFFTARENDDIYFRLIGYSIFVIAKNPHYKNHTWAMSDVLWVDPKYRNLGVGRQFREFWDRGLKTRGVDVVHINAKVAAPALMYLLKDGDYLTTECGMEKRL